MKKTAARMAVARVKNEPDPRDQFFAAMDEDDDDDKDDQLDEELLGLLL